MTDFAKRHPILRGFLIVVGSVFLTFALLGALLVWMMRSPGSFDAATAAVSDAVTPTLTMSKFNAIETGMSYADVVKILGAPGVESSRVELGGTTTVMFTWQNNVGLGNMNAMFQNGKLISKAQFGLN